MLLLSRFRSVVPVTVSRVSRVAVGWKHTAPAKGSIAKANNNAGAAGLKNNEEETSTSTATATKAKKSGYVRNETKNTSAAVTSIAPKKKQQQLQQQAMAENEQDAASFALQEEEVSGLTVAERVRGIIASNYRGQLTTLVSHILLGEGIGQEGEAAAIEKNPVTSTLVQLVDQSTSAMRIVVPSDSPHVRDLAANATASILIGHTDPPPLINTFRRLQRFPPRVLMAGTLMLDQRKEALEEFPMHTVYRFLPHMTQLVGIFDNKLEVESEDLRSAYVDPLAREQHDLVHEINTVFFADLPGFCAAYLGLHVEDALCYSVDRRGFNLFVQKADTKLYTTVRFAFNREILAADALRSQLLEMRNEASNAMAAAVSEQD